MECIDRVKIIIGRADTERSPPGQIPETNRARHRRSETTPRKGHYDDPGIRSWMLRAEGEQRRAVRRHGLMRAVAVEEIRSRDNSSV